MHTSAVRINRDLRRTLVLPFSADGLTDHESPAIEARMLPSRHDIAFDACEQHGLVNPEVVHHHATTDARERARVRNTFARRRGDRETQIAFTTETETRWRRSILHK